MAQYSPKDDRCDRLRRGAATQCADARLYVIALQHTIDAICNAEARVHQVLADRLKVSNRRRVPYRVHCVSVPQLVVGPR